MLQLVVGISVLVVRSIGVLGVLSLLAVSNGGRGATPDK